MKRDVLATINEYDSRFSAEEKGSEFYASEMLSIDDMSNDKFDLLNNAFKFAFVCGFKYGKSVSKNNK